MSTALKFAKPRPYALNKREQQARVRTIDRAELGKCRQRSRGRCEVRELVILSSGLGGGVRRCTRHASENHHLVGGIGRKNIGRSILAAHRIDCCMRCHKEITAHILQPVGPAREDAATVTYERLR